MRLFALIISGTLALVSSGCSSSGGHRESNSMTMESDDNGGRTTRFEARSTYSKLGEATGNNADSLIVGTQNNAEELTRRVQGNSSAARTERRTTVQVTQSADPFQQRITQVAPPVAPAPFPRAEVTSQQGYGVMSGREQGATNVSLENVFAMNAGIRDTAETQLYVDQSRQTSEMGDIAVSDARFHSGLGKAFGILDLAGSSTATIRGMTGDFRSIFNGGAPNQWEGVIPGNVGPGQFLQGRREVFQPRRFRR